MTDTRKSLRISAEAHKKLKLYSVQNDVHMEKLVEDLVNELLSKNKKGAGRAARK